MQVPATTDLWQADVKLEVPEIRVWLHPHKQPDFKDGDNGDDYYEIFPSFAEALTFIKYHVEAENIPLIAFRGYELNLWAIQA